mmetsp:Transcript_4174/g.6641  ORF Transcript_4174/g.6641 Transcript_4174/m.6641 type:complete len:99 (+) Transcript_4174:85-381(+)
MPAWRKRSESVMILSMVLLSIMTLGVLVVIWKWEGRVPCPGNLGLGSPFLGCLFAVLHAWVEKKIREFNGFINGLAVDDDVGHIGGAMEVGGTRSLSW